MLRRQRHRLAALLALTSTVLFVPLSGVAWSPVASAAAVAADQPASEDARWSWPLSPVPAVTRPFDLPHPYAAGHRGIDLDAVPGAAILAPEDGVIRFAGWVVDRPVVSIAHADGLISTYEPAETTLAVGAAVQRGEAFATLADSPAHAPAGGLHLGARLGDAYLDPLALLGLVPRAVLLPLGPS